MVSALTCLRQPPLYLDNHRNLDIVISISDSGGTVAADMASPTSSSKKHPNPSSSKEAPSLSKKQKVDKPNTIGAATQTSNKDSVKEKKTPIKDLFDTNWKPNLPAKPKFNPAWGRKPMPGQDGPQPHPDQPSARTSNAQTNPPLWEDRGFRIKKGSRYVTSFRRGEKHPEGIPTLLDQTQNLVVKLIDMRPKSKKDSTPRRLPELYCYANGLPKDWDDRQAIKAINDRRQQAIDRITMDAPWSLFERKYLLSLLLEFPDASILELTERFNWRFNGDFANSTAFEWNYVSTGRTIESVRHEYLTYKHKYDQGILPQKKDLEDKSWASKQAGPNRMHKFGKKDKTLLSSGADSDNEDTGSSIPNLPKDVEEELLELAGYRSDKEDNSADGDANSDLHGECDGYSNGDSNDDSNGQSDGKSKDDSSNHSKTESSDESKDESNDEWNDESNDESNGEDRSEDHSEGPNLNHAEAREDNAKDQQVSSEDDGNSKDRFTNN